MLINAMSIYNGRIRSFSASQLASIFTDHYAYEVIRLIRGKALFLELHLDRLLKSCQALRYPPLNKVKVLEEIDFLVQENHLTNINFKIMVFQDQRILFPIESHYPSVDDYLRGVCCSLLFEERENPELKAHQASLRERSNKQIESEEVYESVLVNQQGLITEGSRSNLFFINKDIIFTAEDALVLGGISRAKVLEICELSGLELIKKAISTQELSQCQAAFICGTSPGVLPIKKIESHVFDVQNPLLRIIHQKFHKRYLLT